MHPAFAWGDEAAMRGFVARHGFAQITVADGGRPLSAHSPIAFDPAGTPCFHLARANPLTPLLDGRPVLASVVVDAGYVSPDWYGTADQVPTWNYRLVEIAGTARRLDEAGLVDLLDRLGDAQEAQLAPKPPWKLAKLAPARLAMLLRGIAGFAIDDAAFHGVRKLGQNKSAAERAGAVAGLRARGAHALADAMAGA